ncbi:DUF3427 domain-containing protein [Streptomyces sp. CAU 1734]|uniref:DEAD/DEAH box helicase n=1 Tax=Streptomyces sp. CAU 1734 TaxID=3140360 RepID=UPI0032607162
MTDVADSNSPVAGLYEQLITLRVENQLKSLSSDGILHAIDGEVGSDSSAQILARHVANTARQVLEALPPEERVQAANHMLNSMSSLPNAEELIDLVAEGPRQLLAVAEQQAEGVYAIRPVTPLSDTGLITNAPEDPSLGFELRAELETTDRVDLLCAFVKWHGLRVIEKSLEVAHDRQVPIRVITTTYIGATERRALDRLVQRFNAQVKINYEIRSTRLHAKAWLFRRNSGYDTAYIGSSNLSRSALLDGLEWNVRLSSVATPAILKKFETTFDSYWRDPAFESYDPIRDAARLDRALQISGNGASNTEGDRIALSGLDVHPYPFQRDMLERLEVERTVHDRHRNLLVAATGTGKTVMAALDFKQLKKRHGRNLRLLFIAHRQEILQQSMRKYRDILGDVQFGEEFYSGKRPEEWKNVFASIQSLKEGELEKLSPDQFDVIVIDEFHHSVSPTYRRVIDYFTPMELLGLTATPERMDGKNVQDEFFEGRIAAEMRLWEALNNELLSPFHYFGISDGTDLKSVTWKRGAYDASELSDALTGNIDRAQHVVDAVQEKVSAPTAMRALGFCVSVAHAEFMADFFRSKGFKAVALSGETKQHTREAALDSLKSGEIQVVFSVDLFNEGLDVPDVDTLLLLRPTSSATVFLQQIGRGLRRSETKAVLTILDFIGQHRKEFRFEEQFRVLTNLSRGRLLANMERDFPSLPQGCHIILEKKAKEAIIENIRSQIRVDVRHLTEEVKRYGSINLAGYLKESGRELKELYRGSENSWTRLLRRARLLPQKAPEGEWELLKRMTSFLYVDDPARAKAYASFLSDEGLNYTTLSEQSQAYARMLYFTLWPKGKFATYQEGLDYLLPQKAFRDEARAVLARTLEKADHLPISLTGELSDLPLTVHASYNREEILAALGESFIGGFMPDNFREGARWCKSARVDALFITLEKEEKDFSPTTRYKDYAEGSFRFHWESQRQTSSTSPTGLRYQNHKEEGTHVFLFVRRYKSTDIGGPHPWMLLGPAKYIGHERSKPMAITWELVHEIPADVWTYSAATAVS